MPSSCILQLCVWHDETPKLELLADPLPNEEQKITFVVVDVLSSMNEHLFLELPSSCIYRMWVWHDGNLNLELSSTSPSRRRRHRGGTKICSLSFKNSKDRVLAKGEGEVEGRVAERDGSNAVAGRTKGRPDVALMEDTRTTQYIADRLFFSMSLFPKNTRWLATAADFGGMQGTGQGTVGEAQQRSGVSERLTGTESGLNAFLNQAGDLS